MDLSRGRGVQLANLHDELISARRWGLGSHLDPGRRSMSRLLRLAQARSCPGCLPDFETPSRGPSCSRWCNKLNWRVHSRALQKLLRVSSYSTDETRSPPGHAAAWLLFSAGSIWLWRDPVPIPDFKLLTVRVSRPKLGRRVGPAGDLHRCIEPCSILARVFLLRPLRLGTSLYPEDAAEPRWAHHANSPP